MGSHTLQQLRRYSFDELKELFKTTMKNVNAFIPMETEDRGRASELAAGSSQATIIDSAKVGSSKRDAEVEHDHEGSKRQKTNEASGSVQEQPDEEDKELSNIQSLTGREDLVMLWSLVKETFSSTKPTDDKERTLWVELKRLFEPNTDDTLWKLQRYMHDPLKWRLYDTCGVHHVSTERGIDIFMLVEKEYPLTKGVLMLMLVNKLSPEEKDGWRNELSKYRHMISRTSKERRSVVKKFFGQGEQVQETSDANEGKETIEEGSSVGIILVSPDEKMHSYAIRLRFNTFDHAINCEALLAGLAAFVSKGMKDLHVFMDSPKLVARTEGNHTPATE
ncbi:hypothetical protein Tco_0532469 [Tanacetum coccineum]